MSNLPINPEVMRWARESAGLSIDDVVEKMKRKGVTADVVAAWEEGGKSPSYPQLERLAYEIYRRPLAIFFFPQPPEELTPEQSFRTLPESEIGLLSPRIRYLFRKAAALQLNLSELHDGSNPAERQIVKEIDFDPKTSMTEILQRVWDFLSVDLKKPIDLENSEPAVEFWRERLERFGVSVFEDAFEDDTLSGFCLYDDEFPLIYVNNSMSFNRQIFTLFHELAHLLFKTGGVDINKKGRFDSFEGDGHPIEISCDEFAAEFLVSPRHKSGFIHIIRHQSAIDGEANESKTPKRRAVRE
ncbi:MAG: ImmA/IrrE family metallo-endopeptidase [Ectothiorhodospiraceae bacterium AqS1]|nr:ImmA/IrrE family metallo-endopeptidase [Ectothiorhodospiraceae bacterium AqS1]